MYETWKSGKYPEAVANASGDDIDAEKLDNFEALQIAPMAVKHGLNENLESNGNPTSAWITVKDYSVADAREKKDSKFKPREQKWEIPEDLKKKIQGSPLSSENGYWFARRTDPENASVGDYKWGNPGNVGQDIISLLLQSPKEMTNIIVHSSSGRRLVD